MFETVQAAPVDPILGLTEAFKADPSPDKINLSVGVYQDSSGATPLLASVAEAARRVVAGEKTKSYLPIPGAPEYARAVQELMFGPTHEIVQTKRAATSHTPGGTAALRVVADFLHQNFPGTTIWMTQPTWPNHPQVFQAAGVPVKSFPYFDKQTNGLALDAALEAIADMPKGDAILLHGCCHNPTGIDPTPQQWRTLADAVAKQGLLPILDYAYQGFAEGVEEDSLGLLTFCRPGCELIVCSSFSKNFGLYRERVGAVTFIAADAATTDKVQSQVKQAIRSNYSNPPAHGAALVTTILGDPELRRQWLGEVAQMRDRINGMRKLFVRKLAQHGVPGDFSFIEKQRGMFSFSSLTKDQVDALRNQHAIYIVGSGRINVAGVTEGNVDRLCKAIAEVVKG